MKNVGLMVALSLFSLTLLACNNTNEPTAPSESTQNENNDEVEIAEEEDEVTNDQNEQNIEEEPSSNSDAVNTDNEEDQDEQTDYSEEKVSGDYLIYIERLDGIDIMYHFTRTTDDMTREQLLHQSFIESDPSQNELFSAVTDFEVKGNVANLYYNEDDTLSTASTESSQFWDVVDEIGFRYDIDEVNLFNQDGERGLIFAENDWEEPINIEQEPNRGYYVMSPEKTERGENTYIGVVTVEEEIYTAEGELMDFSETVEAMATVENDEASYYSGIYEGLEIEEATIESDQATVRYTTKDGIEAPEQERKDFEQVLQLAAMDFQVDELKIVNETESIISTFPLVIKD
ncbi:hypothetical protein [Alkalicoccobacillus murimartini]|uniref:GerMN domain-containing protein n=1 Tax=Alkalicoccobacillus murimartini TaxID=171685 RepID=A0ABT9YLH1_9BACI|nr:hypothetical protein [Alkalicoccobacillus murimartini]MDQ0208336.1 hypothetical protein [Alkalicoccobacillus murimartini]